MTKNSRVILVSLLTAVSALSCGEIEPGEDLARAEFEAVAGNGITMNGITMNGITMNGITMNGATGGFDTTLLTEMAAVGLDQLTENATMKHALEDRNARRVVRYMVQCALDTTQTATFKDDLGWEEDFTGLFGLATDWYGAAGSCGETCKRWVSACLYARINAKSTRILLSMRMPHGAHGGTAAEAALADIGTEELAGFAGAESAFWGNYWVWHVDPTWKYLPAIYVCAGRDFKEIDALRNRLCEGKACPQVVGYCSAHKPCPYWSKACTVEDAENKAVNTCTINDDVCLGWPTPYTEVITVFRSFTKPAHVDYATGVAIPWHASPCANTIHNSGLMPSCTAPDGWWGSACAKLSRQYCADHDLAVTGEPLQRGSSDCVDAVCKANAACCDNEWSAACVTKAKELCPVLFAKPVPWPWF